VDTPGDDGLTEPEPGRSVDPSSDDGEHATTIAATAMRQTVKVDRVINPTYATSIPTCARANCGLIGSLLMPADWDHEDPRWIRRPTGFPGNFRAEAPQYGDSPT
jgi:hypothetical protein